MDQITFEDFTKLDIRVGTITSAEKVPKAKKILKLEVSFGPEVGTRTIMAGIALDFEPEYLINTQVTAVLNLVPREMFGVMSNGMLLAGRQEAGKLALVCCVGVPDGGKIG